MINRAEIKQEAKSIMWGARVSPVLMGTLVLAISLILDRIISLVEYGTFFPDFRIFQSLSYLASVDPMLLLEMDTNDMLALAGLASSATVYSLFFSILVSLFMTVLYGGFYLYCMGIRQGREMPVSPDPMAPQLQAHLAGIRLGEPDSCTAQLRPILSNAAIFGVDLYQAGLGGRVEEMFRAMLAGPGAVRGTLRHYLSLAGA